MRTRHAIREVGLCALLASCTSDTGSLVPTDGGIAPPPVQTAACGDGAIDPGESCDDGAANDGRYAGCNSDCTLAARCGDGQRDRIELCDDGGANSMEPGACRPDCSLPACSDGVRDPGEICLGRSHVLAADAQLLYGSHYYDRTGDGRNDLILISADEISILANEGRGFVRLQTKPNLEPALFYFELVRDLDAPSSLFGFGEGHGLSFEAMPDGTLADPHPFATAPSFGDYRLALTFAASPFNLLFLGSTEGEDATHVFASRLGDTGFEDAAQILALPAPDGGRSGFTGVLSADMDGDASEDLLLQRSYDPMWARIHDGVIDELRPLVNEPAGHALPIDLDDGDLTDFLLRTGGSWVPFANESGMLRRAGPELIDEPGVFGVIDVELDGIDEYLHLSDAGLLRVRDLPSGELRQELDFAAPNAILGLWFPTGDLESQEIVVHVGLAAFAYDRPDDGLLGTPSVHRFDVESHFATPSDIDGDDRQDYVLSGSIGTGFVRGIEQDTVQSHELARPGALISDPRLELFDVDGDGVRDLIGNIDGSATIAWMKNSGGVLADPIPIAAGAATGRFALADGALVVARAGTIDVLRDAGGSFVLTATIAIAGDPERIIAADFTGDGEADLLYAEETGRIALVTGGSEAMSLTLAPGRIDLTAAQLDADPELEVVAINRDAGMLAVVDGFAVTLELPLDAPRRVIAADFDSDGVDELAIAVSSGIQILRDLAIAELRPLTYTAVALAADDGQLIALSENSPLQQYATVFSVEDELVDRGTFYVRRHALAIAMGDLDGDGLPDLATSAREFGLLQTEPPDVTTYLSHP